MSTLTCIEQYDGIVMITLQLVVIQPRNFIFEGWTKELCELVCAGRYSLVFTVSFLFNSKLIKNICSRTLII